MYSFSKLRTSIGALPFAELIPIELLLTLAAATIFVLAGAFYVYAGDAAAVIVPESLATHIWNLISPILVVVVSVFGPVAGSYLIVQLIGLLKITDQAKRVEVEAQLRWALHAAAEGGLKYAFAKAGIPPSATPPASVIADALFYVQGKNPDAVQAFDLDDDDIKHIILSKIPELIASLAPIASTTITQLIAPPSGPAPTPAAPDGPQAAASAAA